MRTVHAPPGPELFSILNLSSTQSEGQTLSFYLKDCVSGVYKLDTENLISEYRKLVFPVYIIEIACVFLIIKAVKGCIIKWGFKLTPFYCFAVQQRSSSTVSCIFSQKNKRTCAHLYVCVSFLC